jgi:hypothetical protein
MASPRLRAGSRASRAFQMEVSSGGIDGGDRQRAEDCPIGWLVRAHIAVDACTGGLHESVGVPADSSSLSSVDAPTQGPRECQMVRHIRR